ncbi:MAG: hypothetical protein WKF94_01365 [Solirubrobacteraceae bacterium]
MVDQQLTGGCGCGAVRFTLSAPLQAAYAAVWEPIPDDGLPRYDERIPSR